MEQSKYTPPPMKKLEDARVRLVAAKYRNFDLMVPIAIRKKVRSGEWVVMNAPRPLYGSYASERIDGVEEAMTWNGDFISGVFYAGVDITDERVIDNNVKLDAAIIRWVEDDEILAHGQAIAEEYNVDPETVEGWSFDEIWGSYLNTHDDRR
jgi:hypothetical protein